jgi:cytochrome c biogenesis protein CcmG/thiol:disulfide interchange protein DsbE
LLLMLLALGALALWLGRRTSGPEPGTLATDFALPVVSSERETFRLSEQRGKPVLVEVFASWCSVCRRAAPTLSEVARAPRQREVRFVGVSVDERSEDARAVAREWEIPYAVLHDDGRFARSYQVTLLPTFVLIDAEGKIRRVSSGSPSRKELESWLGELGAARL